MAQVIDALWVSLGLDPKGFKKGMKESEGALSGLAASAARAQKDVDAATKKMADGYKKLYDGVLAVTAAVVGAVAGKAVVERLTQQDAAIARTAKNVNMSAQEMKDWRGVAERLGGTADGMTGSIKSLSGELQKMALTGKSEIIPFLVQAHVDLQKFFNASTPMAERLKLISDGLRGLDPARAQALGAGMGLDEGTVNVLMNSRSALDELLAKQRAMNGITDDNTKASIALKNAWADLQDTGEGFARKLLAIVTPALIGLLKALQALVDFAQNHMPIAVPVVMALTSALTALSVIKFASLLGGLSQVTGSLGSAAGVAASLAKWLGMIGAALGVAGLADAALSAIDPKDKLGSWIDKHIPGAAAVDNFASKFGLGRSYTEQGQGPAAAGRPSAAGGAAISDRQQFLRNLEARFGLPAGVLDAIWLQESSRGKNMLSPAGAKGDFGFMDKTAAAYGVDVKSFESSAQGAARMLADLLRQFHGDLPSALTAYNWGAGNLMRKGMGNAPLQAINYAPSIMGSMSAARRADVGGGTQIQVDQIAQTMVIHTAATNAADLGRDITANLRRSITTQHNTGIE